MTMDEGVIIILSEDDDSEDEESCSLLCSEPSVLIVEEVENSDSALIHPSVLDEDLVVTFSRCAEVLPHARYDCPIHRFTATDRETSAPVANNHLNCDQCFCYVCDKLASSCVVWCKTGVCHCNSHKRSEFWSSLRNSVVLGYLKTFNLTLCEIDTHLRHAETMLQSFRAELAAEFSAFLKGKTAQEYGLSQSNQRGLVHDYTRVYECVSLFLSKADKQEDRAAAIMRLGAAQDLIAHYQPSGIVMSESPMANASEAKVTLLQRVIASVQKQMVMADFTPEFIHKLKDFYQRLHVPPTLRSMRNSLCVRPWDDVLLVSVLKGQNVTGVRKDKGKKDLLVEKISVVLLRTERLQCQRRYRELCRYLRVVQTDDSKLFQELRDLHPLFLCKAGDFTSALSSFFPSPSGPASRFSPYLFLLYLRVFETATAPMVTIGHPGRLVFPDATWEPIEAAVPLKRVELVKFALRAQRCCASVYADSQCWTHLLTIINTPRDSATPPPEPTPAFLHDAKDVVRAILLNQQGCSIQIPRLFHDVYPDQSLLLLVTGALALRVMDAPLSPALPVLNTFERNVWALEWLWDSLSSTSDCFHSFMQGVTQELEHMADGGNTLPFLPSVSPSSPEKWDHTYCSPVAVEHHSSKVKAPMVVVAGPDSRSVLLADPWTS